jgi:hypothetical protein
MFSTDSASYSEDLARLDDTEPCCPDIIRFEEEPLPIRPDGSNMHVVARIQELPEEVLSYCDEYLTLLMNLCQDEEDEFKANDDVPGRPGVDNTSIIRENSWAVNSGLPTTRPCESSSMTSSKTNRNSSYYALSQATNNITDISSNSHWQGPLPQNTEPTTTTTAPGTSTAAAEQTAVLTSLNVREEPTCSLSYRSQPRVYSMLRSLDDGAATSSSSKIDQDDFVLPLQATNAGPAAPTPADTITAQVRSTTGGASVGSETAIYPFQNKKWMERYSDLLEFKKKQGHCHVPFHYKENPALSQWVKRQRHQYKLWEARKHSHINSERIQMLEMLGFTWDSHAASWEENFQALKDFKDTHGHIHVPIANAQLSTWVKRQRRQYNQYIANQPSTMTPEKVHRLSELGLVWRKRGG